MRNLHKIQEVLRAEQKGYKDANKAVVSADQQTYTNLVESAFSNVSIELDQDNLSKSQARVKELTEGKEAVYGITTSFGGNIKNLITPDKTNQLQYNLATSHITNVGSYLPYEYCKAATLLRLSTVSKGYSGITWETISLLKALLEKGLVPAIRAHGSMGASGDLGPLSAIANTLIGQGELYLPDKVTVVPALEALKKFNLEPIELKYRDGLTLINGTSVMTAIASFYLWYIKRLLENSLAISALTIEAIKGSKEPFDPRLHQLKPHRFQVNVAAVMSSLLRDSKMARSHEDLKSEVGQDIKENVDDRPVSKSDLQGGSYSLRAIPQIYQPILALFDQFKNTINTEINAVDDNPLFMVEDEVELHGANFHGHPVSVITDSLNLAIISVANTSTARIDRLLKAHHSTLPAFLGTGQEGLYLGMQGAQYTAAGISAELRALAYPLSVNQIVTNNDNQDIVSFGLQANLKGIEITHLLAYVLAVEYISVSQAVWIRVNQEGVDESSFSPLTWAIYKKIQPLYESKADTDQELIEPIEKVANMLLLEELLPTDLQKTLWQA